MRMFDKINEHGKSMESMVCMERMRMFDKINEHGRSMESMVCEILIK